MRIDRHLSDDPNDPEAIVLAMAPDIRAAFGSSPHILHPAWLYDDRGSELFDQITRTPEYYQTEAERSILAEYSADIAELSGADTVIELGSGTSDKTRTLLDAFWGRGQLKRFVPMDVSEQTLVDAAVALDERYDGLEIHGVVGDFNKHLGLLPDGGCRLLAFLGGTIGNFDGPDRAVFLKAIADTLAPGDSILLGFEPVKNLERILAAYNDSAGITDAFILNVLNVLNARLDANFSTDDFAYVAFWDGKEERVDMRLRNRAPVSARIERLDIDVELGSGEEIRVEISTKFRPERITAELDEAGFDINHLWLSSADETGHLQDGDFGLILGTRR